jgi:integrase/recombinase XerD
MMNFSSNLSTHLTEFLAFKRSMGIKYKTPEYYLFKLDQFNFENGNYSTLTENVVTKWLLKMADETNSLNRSWIPPIREFGRYLRRIGIKDAYLISDNFVTQMYRAETYLMTTSEIKIFFRECDRLAKSPTLKVGMGFVYPALYRLIYCCGLRPIEARMLRLSDVNLKDGFIDVMHSKGHRDRRLYLSEELTTYLIGYEKNISQIKPNRQYFFPGGCSELCSPAFLSSTFTKIWIKAGLPYEGKVKPRLYDFRHHFAYANIMKWSFDGKNVYSMLAYLMKYMGHSSLESTYYYVHLSSDFYKQYKDLSKPTEDILPEVKEDEI